MIKTLFPRWKKREGFEEIISRAALNAQLSLPIISYLLKQDKGSINSEVIESCASSAFADREMISLLLKAAPGISLGPETVEAASNRPQHFFGILAVLKAHDPDVQITKAAMYNVVSFSFNIVQTIKQLREYHHELVITEGLMKSVVQNINANDATIVSLCEFQREQLPTGMSNDRVSICRLPTFPEDDRVKCRLNDFPAADNLALLDGTLPITEEIIATAIQNSGNGAVSMVRRLLSLQPAGEWNAEINEQRLAVAIDSYRAKAMVSIILGHAHQNQRTIKVTPDALRNAARNKTLKILLKLLQTEDVENITASGVLEAAAKNKSQLELLRVYAAERGLTLSVDQAVFEHAISGSKEAAKAVLRFWSSSGQTILTQSSVTERALMNAASHLKFFNRPDGPGNTENSTYHWLLRYVASLHLWVVFSTQGYVKILFFALV